MAVRLEFISLIIPIEKIERAYPGGFAKCLQDDGEAVGGKIWYDKHLYRDGAMSYRDMGHLVEWWEERGLTAVVERNGEKEFRDMCVVDHISGPTLPCGWLEHDWEGDCVYLHGTEKGNEIGRAEMRAQLGLPAKLE